MDTELRAYLEAMEQRAVARDAETREVLRAEIAATRAVAEAALQVGIAARTSADAARAEAAAAQRSAEAAQRSADAAQQSADAFRVETRVLHEETWRKIDALGEGLTIHQRAEAARLDAACEETLLHSHILPLEASAANHEKRISALEEGGEA